MSIPERIAKTVPTLQPTPEDPSLGRRIYIGNVDASCTEAEITAEFVRFGPVQRVDMKSGFAFVELATVEQARAASAAMDGQTFKGRRVIVEIAKGSKSLRARRASNRGAWRIHLEGLDPKTSWQDLKDFARSAAAGPISFTDVWMDQGKKYGVVEYMEEKDMDSALRQLDGTLLDGARVTMRAEGTRRSLPVRSNVVDTTKTKRRSRSRSRSKSRSRSHSKSRSRRSKSRSRRSNSRSYHQTRASKRSSRRSRSRSRSRLRSRSPLHARSRHLHRDRSRSRSTDRHHRVGDRQERREEGRGEAKRISANHVVPTVPTQNGSSSHKPLVVVPRSLIPAMPSKANISTPESAGLAATSSTPPVAASQQSIATRAGATAQAPQQALPPVKDPTRDSKKQESAQIAALEAKLAEMKAQHEKELEQIAQMVTSNQVQQQQQLAMQQLQASNAVRLAHEQAAMTQAYRSMVHSQPLFSMPPSMAPPSMGLGVVGGNGGNGMPAMAGMPWMNGTGLFNSLSATSNNSMSLIGSGSESGTGGPSAATLAALAAPPVAPLKSATNLAVGAGPGAGPTPATSTPAASASASASASFSNSVSNSSGSNSGFNSGSNSGSNNNNQGGFVVPALPLLKTVKSTSPTSTPVSVFGSAAMQLTPYVPLPAATSPPNFDPRPLSSGFTSTAQVLLSAPKK